MRQMVATKFGATRDSCCRVALHWAADATTGRTQHGGVGSWGIVGGRGGTQTAGAVVERRRRRDTPTTTLTRRRLRGRKSSATTRYAFVAILDNGRGESRLARGEGKKGRVQAGVVNRVQRSRHCKYFGCSHTVKTLQALRHCRQCRASRQPRGLQAM